jgi:hypothetical protein
MSKANVDELRAKANQLFTDPELNLQANVILDKLESLYERAGANPTAQQQAAMMREAEESKNEIKRLLGEIALRALRKEKV